VEVPPPSYREILRIRKFLYYFLSQATGDAGYAVYAIAIPWLALELSKSVFVVGLVIGVEFGIYALSFLIGPFVDRVHDLRTILLIGYPLQAGLAFLLGLFEQTGTLTVPILLALVVGISFVWDFTWTASNAIPPAIVPEGALFRANGLTSAVSGGNQIAGYAAGAGLILLVGPSGAMFLYAGLNLVASVLSIAVTAPHSVPTSGSFLVEFREGWHYFVGGVARPLLQLSLYSSLEGFFSATPTILLTIFAATRFPNPSGTYGLLFTAFALGGILGGLLLGQINPRRRIGWTMSVIALLEGATLLAAIAVVPNLVGSLVAWFAVGIVEVGFYVTLVVFIQATAPAPVLGRTLTNTYLLRGGSRAIGAVVIGALVVSLGPLALGQTVVVALLAVGLIGPLAFPVVRRMRF
jgi:MFS family permease